jgi:hypothetical protein
LALAAATKSANPLAEAAERKKESIMQCYFVFFTTFLWRSNFPSLLINNTNSSSFQHEKYVFTMINAIFNTGLNPSVTTGKSFLGGDDTGLYKKFESTQKATLTKEYFRILQLLGKALETSGTETLLTKAANPKDFSFAKEYIKQVDRVSKIYSTETFTQKAERAVAESENKNYPPPPKPFVESATDLMIAHQPNLDTSILQRRIVVDGDTIKILEDTKLEAYKKANLNYSVLFYTFLDLMRDYLISIENTGEQCQLPAFLKTFGK